MAITKASTFDRDPVLADFALKGSRLADRTCDRLRQASAGLLDRVAAFGGRRDGQDNELMTHGTHRRRIGLAVTARHHRLLVRILAALIQGMRKSRALVVIAAFLLATCTSLSVPMNEPVRSAAGNAE